MGKSVRTLLGTEPELMVASNLVRQVYNDDQDPKLLKIITCNKKYAAEIKEAVGKLSASIDSSMEHLVMQERWSGVEGGWCPEWLNRNLKRVPDTLGTGLRRLSGTMVVHTPTGSTSSASTPTLLRESEPYDSSEYAGEVIPVLCLLLSLEIFKQFMKDSEGQGGEGSCFRCRCSYCSWCLQ